MTLRWAYEAGIALACTLALLAVLLGGELPWPLWFTVAIPCIGSVLHVHGRMLSGWFGSIIAFLGFALGVTYLLMLGIGALLLGAAIAMVMALVARLLTRRALRDDLQALLISLLLVFSGAGLHTEVTYGVIFVAYAIFVVWALITRELVAGAEREHAREGGKALHFTLNRKDVVTPKLFLVTGGVALAILLSTSIVFVMFPRVGFGTLAFLARGSAKLPNEVSLFHAPRGAGGGAVIARVRGLSESNFAQGLYLRAASYGFLTSTGFQRGDDALYGASERLPLHADTDRITYEVYMQSLGTSQMLTLGPVEDVRLLAGGFGNPNLRAQIHWFGHAGILQSPLPLAGPVRYEVAGRIARPTLGTLRGEPAALTLPLNERQQTALTKLPEATSPRIVALAQDLTHGKPTPEEKAAALRTYLQTRFLYTLDVPAPTAEDPLEFFLFDAQEGHCEFFATAFAVLLRAAGVPSRVAGGFAGGRWDSAEKVAVFTAADAHAWTEWFSPSHGWVVDDATPARDGSIMYLQGMAAWLETVRRAWDDYVLEYGVAEQAEMFRRMGEAVSGFRQRERQSLAISWRSVAVGATIVAVLMLGWLLLRRRKRDESALARLLANTLQRLQQKPIQHHHTFRRALDDIAPLLERDDMQALTAVVELYERERFGERTTSAASLRQARRILYDIDVSKGQSSQHA